MPGRTTALPLQLEHIAGMENAAELMQPHHEGKQGTAGTVAVCLGIARL